MGPGLPQRIHRLRHVFPLEFVQLSRFAVLLAGFALVVSSLNLYRRKKRALHFVVVISALSVVLHLTKGIDYEEALLSAILLGLDAKLDLVVVPYAGGGPSIAAVVGNQVSFGCQAIPPDPAE